MAVVRAYATITDCICSGLSPSDAAMLGRAVFRMVASSVCMKKPTATSHNRRSLAMEEVGGTAFMDKKMS